MCKKILITILLIFIFTIVFIFLKVNISTQSQFLQCSVKSLEMFTYNEKKAVNNYREIKKIINYIDSIDYIDEENQKMIIGGNVISIRIIRKNNIKYKNEYLVFYNKHIRYMCYNDYSNLLVDKWYIGDKDTFSMIKNFYDKVK